MKVKELIEILKSCNEDDCIITENYDACEGMYLYYDVINIDKGLMYKSKYDTIVFVGENDHNRYSMPSSATPCLLIS